MNRNVSIRSSEFQISNSLTAALLTIVNLVIVNINVKDVGKQLAEFKRVKLFLATA